MVDQEFRNGRSISDRATQYRQEINQEPPSDPGACRGTRKDGQPCTAKAHLHGYCIGHRGQAEGS